MTRTKPLHLVLIGLLGIVAMWFVETALAATGRPVVVPPFTLAVALLLIGVVIVVLALPVRRVARGDRTARVDPFYATRVVLLAKASSLVGALLGGAGIGIVAYLLSRSVIPAAGSVAMAIGSAIGALLLLAAGLIAEHMCAIPPEDDDGRPGLPDTGGAR